MDTNIPKEGNHGHTTATLSRRRIASIVAALSIFSFGAYVNDANAQCADGDTKSCTTVEAGNKCMRPREISILLNTTSTAGVQFKMR
jgi:hypothetical protein